MEFIFFGLSGVIGGVLGGMGMGGGTLLIPILTIFLKQNQHLAQAINLIAFIPMAIVALIIHAKKKRVMFGNTFLIIAFGILASLGGCFIAKWTSGDTLSRCFGAFLIVLAIFQFIMQLKSKKME